MTNQNTRAASAGKTARAAACGMLATAALGLAAVAPAPAMAADLPASTPLRVSADESSLEQLIYNYLKARADFEMERIYYDDAEEDLGLRLIDKAHGVTYQIHVDTDSSGSNNSERAIHVRGFVVLKDNLDQAALHAAINDYQNRFWAPGQVYLDNDGDLAFQTVVNIPHTTVTVHPEMIYDTIVRTRLGLHDHLLPVISSNRWHKE